MSEITPWQLEVALARTPEGLKANSYYKSRYEEALEFANKIGPPWEDLTHEQRMNVKNEVIRYTIELNNMFKAP